MDPASAHHEPFSSVYSPSVCPPFAALDVASVPFNHWGYSLLGYVLPLPVLKSLLPLIRLDRGPGPFWSQGGSCFQSLSPSLLRRQTSTNTPVSPRILMSSGSCCLRLGTLLCIFKRPGHLHSLSIARPRPHPYATWACGRRSGDLYPPPCPPPLPPGVLLIPYMSVLVVCNFRAQRKILMLWSGLFC